MANSSVRSDIMTLIKKRFGEFAVWERIESKVAILCAELTEPISENKKERFIQDLDGIRSYLNDSGIEREDLAFFDEEIDRHKFTKTISLYVEDDDAVEATIVEKYARLGAGTEGVVGIHKPYNYTQLSKLTNGVFNKTGLIKFYISKEQKIYGQINAEFGDGRIQNIPIAKLIESKSMNKETSEPKYRKIALFGERYNVRDVNLLKEINIPFYVYRMITEKNEELVLFTAEKCEIGDYIIEGVMTKCDDYKMLTDSARLPTKLPFFFAQSIKNRIVKYNNHSELSEKLKELNFNRKNAYEYPFAVNVKGSSYELLNPKWYKNLTWAWLTHQPKGLYRQYPMHIMVLGPKGSGKSSLLDTLHANSKETKDVFSGVSSTLKHLVPSFRNNPAKLGYLAESNRFSFCDEFLRCLVRTRTTSDGSDREESVGMMNDLLEHQKRQAGSGISCVNVNMTARVFATTNPVRGINNVNDLVNTLDESFLSRWLIYYQTDEHVQMIRRSNDSDLKPYEYRLASNDWVSILDYIHTFSAEFNKDRLKEIYASIPNILSKDLASHYDARHKHHLECLADGVVKTRCILDNDMKFTAIEEDYKTLKEIWSQVVGSWVNADKLFELPMNERIFYAPEGSQFIYWKLDSLRRVTTMNEMREIVGTSMTDAEFKEGWDMLLNLGIIVDQAGSIITHYVNKFNKENDIHSR